MRRESRTERERTENKGSGVREVGKRRGGDKSRGKKVKKDGRGSEGGRSRNSYVTI